MEKYPLLSIVISIIALIISAATAYNQYQTRQDLVNEKMKIELKMMLDNKLLNALDLRMISGVDERKDLNAAISITNTGSAPVRILEVGYQDWDLPTHAFYADAENPK